MKATMGQAAYNDGLGGPTMAYRDDLEALNAQVRTLKAELEALSTKTYSPRFWAKKAVAV